MSIETVLKSDYSNPAAENLLFDLEKKGLRIIARSGQLVVKPKKAIPADVRPLIQKHKSGLLKLVKKLPVSADRISIIRQLFSPPGIAAMKLLLAIKPRKGTYMLNPLPPSLMMNSESLGSLLVMDRVFSELSG